MLNFFILASSLVANFQIVDKARCSLFGCFFIYKKNKQCFLCRVFDERLDSLTTPELDEPKESNSEAAEKKLALPLETFKRQLNRLYLLTEGLPRNPDACKSRSVPVNQVRGLLFLPSVNKRLSRWNRMKFQTLGSPKIYAIPLRK